MTIQRKILGGYLWLAILVIALVAVGVSLVVWLSSWRSDYSDTVEQVQRANEIVIGEASMLNYVLLPLFDSFGENQAAYAEQLERYAASARDALAAAAGSEGSEAEAEDLAALESMTTLFAQYEQVVADTMALAQTFPAQAGAKATEEVLPLARQLDEAAEAYKQVQLEEQTVLLESLAGRSNLMLIGMAILAFVAIAGAIATSVLLSRMIAKQLRSAATSIRHSANGLLAIASQVAASAAQTASSANETTATVEEVKQTALLAHEKASHVADSSKNLVDVAETGRVTVEETIAGFDRIASQMSVMAETINRLSEQTQAVGDIITTVNDLAEQSNLLSVNASIEAAKAGDQGKGFTVVAQEVKSLAEQSKQAVAQVRTILGEIQKASTVAVQAAEQGRETVAAGRQQSLDSGESAHVITETASEAAQSAVQISASSQQQLAGMEQISQAIENISQAGAQSAEGTKQVEQEVKQLQDLAIGLSRLVDARATA